MGLVDKDDGWRMPGWLLERIELLLPVPEDGHPLGCHRPRVPNRAAMDAILLVLRTGMRWNALPPQRKRICHPLDKPHQTVAHLDRRHPYCSRSSTATSSNDDR